MTAESTTLRVRAAASAAAAAVDRRARGNPGCGWFGGSVAGYAARVRAHPIAA